MADIVTNLDLIQQSQAQKEVAANALFDASSPNTLYGRQARTTMGLTWGYYGGVYKSNPTTRQKINNGTLTLTASATNYIEADTTTGAVTVNTSGFTTGGAKIPLYKVVTSATAVTSYEDWRPGGIVAAAGVSGFVSPTTTKGDLIARDASADTRLGVGADGQMLVADSSTATGLKWAASASSPLTTKGDVYTHDSGADARLPVGANGQALLADSTQPTGLRWGTAATPSPTTTKGDLIARGASADDRLPVGGNGQVLQADSAQTLGVRWHALDASDIIYSGGTVGDELDALDAAVTAGASPTTTLGDLIVHGASADERLAIGSNVDVLMVNSGAPLGVAWTHLTAGNVAAAPHGSTTATDVQGQLNQITDEVAAIIAGGGVVPGGSSGSVQYNSGGAFAGGDTLTYDAALVQLTVTGQPISQKNPKVHILAQNLSGATALIHTQAGSTDWYFGSRRTGDAWAVSTSASLSTPSLEVLAGGVHVPGDGQVDGALQLGGRLDMVTTTDAMLPPRVTTSQKNAITPSEGMVVYDTDLHTLQQYTGSAWAGMGGGGTAAGADKQVQFNDGGAFGASSGFTFDKTTGALYNAGQIGVGAAAPGYAKFEVGGVLPSSSAITVAYNADGIIPSTTTSGAYCINAALSTQAAAFTLPFLHEYRAANPSVGAGSQITELVGFDCEPLDAATNIYGFRSAVANAANRYNFYASGNAPNYFAGSVGLGATPRAAIKLDMQGTLPQSGGYCFGFANTGTVPAAANSEVSAFYAHLFLDGAAGTLPVANSFHATNIAPAGSTVLTVQQGLWIDDLTTGVSNYGVRGQVSAGANKWNLYLDGTAPNYFAGQVSIGTTAPDSHCKVDIGGAFSNNDGSEGWGLLIDGTFPSLSLAARVIKIAPQITGGGTVGNYIGIDLGFPSSGISSGNAFGVLMQDCTVAGAVRGFYSNITAGSQKWNLYFSGDADNYIEGRLGIGVATIDASAKLQINSTTKGFLPPRMTTAQKNAISSPAEGLLVYDTDLHSLQQRTNSAWAGFGGSLPAAANDGQQLVADSTATGGARWTSPRYPYKNAFINGAFEVWQRATSFTYSSSSGYTADRWSFIQSSNSASFSFDRDTSQVPTVAQAGFGVYYACKIGIPGSISPSSGQSAVLAQKLEGHIARLFLQRSCTLSFWIRSSKTGTGCCYLRQASLANPSCVVEFTINAVNTWEFKRISIPAASSSALASLNETASVQVGITLLAGSSFQTTPNAWNGGNYLSTAAMTNWTTGGACTIWLCSVQLELGDAYTDFETIPFGDQLDRCERFYQHSFQYGGTVNWAQGASNLSQGMCVGATGNSRLFVPLRRAMRAIPTVTIYNPSNTNNQARNLAANADYSSTATANITEKGFVVSAANGGAFVAGQDISVCWTADAEL